MDKSRRKLIAVASATFAGFVGTGGGGTHEVGVAAIANLDGKTPTKGQVMSLEWSTSDLELLPKDDSGLDKRRSAVASLNQGGHLYITITFDRRDLPAGNSGGVDRVEQHVFVVPDGQIFGAGSVVGPFGSFAVVGGTGRYAKVAGEYNVTFGDLPEGGIGSAQFSFTLRGTN